MRRTELNQGWQFQFYAHNGWTNRFLKPDEGRILDLPHDFRIELERDEASLGDTGEGFYPGGMAVYQKSLILSEEEAAGQVLLYVDGAYRFAEVRINRELVCLHRGGYTPFSADLTGKVRAGQNTLHITCSCMMLPCSRWYTGAGLYRGAALLTGQMPCIAPHGVTVKTLSASQDRAVLSVKTEIIGSGCAAHELYDDQGRLCAAFADGQIALDQPRLWSAQSPRLYTLISRVGQDEVRTPVGIRTVRVSAEEGLLISNAPVKLFGGCIHHDNGPLGAVTDIGIERRRVQLLKDAGFNAIRCAHNPPSEALLNACDEMGLYVIDEAFDAWREGKRTFDEHILFETDWRAELDALITRDRNHPCVILWSTGNEIYERSGASDGAAWAEKLASHVRALDDTRPVLNALCNFFEDSDMAEQALNSMRSTGEGKDFWASRSEAFCAPLDVVGYNYLLERYEKDHALFPARVICGTESFPLQAQENWDAVLKHPYVIGDFVWTAMDYLGESGLGRSSFTAQGSDPEPPAFPIHIANCGDLDINGGKRAQSHYRDFVWTDRIVPHIAVQHPARFGRREAISAWGWPELYDHWTYRGYENAPVSVTVYSAGDEIELLLNGKAVARGGVTAHRSTFEILYQPGELTAVSYKNKKELARASLRTAGPFDHWDLCFEPYRGGAYRFCCITAVDKDGIRVPDHAPEVTVSSSAPIAALSNASPVSPYRYPSDRIAPHNGAFLAVLRTTGQTPKITIT